MNKYILGLALGIGILIQHKTFCIDNLKNKQEQKLVSNCIVKILSEEVKGRKIFGSGFFINNKGDLITASYLVNSASVENMFIEIPEIGNRKFGLEVIKINSQSRLALLRIKKDELEILKSELQVESLPYLEFGNPDHVKRDIEILAFGYVDFTNSKLTNTQGKILGNEMVGNESYLVMTNAFVHAGMAGGPFLDKENKVLGIGIFTCGDYSYMVPVNTIQDFLNS